ncbi:MAG: hypothetical protein GY815_10990 [Gammaproteobacteria bacterium]|nr:hypothetical protein [Gammaproteobacteria bacterium]
MKLTKEMAKDAEESGGKVERIRKKAAKSVPKPAPLPAKPDNSAELKALRAEISELKGLLDTSEKSAVQREQELSAIISALTQEKPVRVKPVRNMSPKDPDYLLVEYYDFIPVSYRKLNS